MVFWIFKNLTIKKTNSTQSKKKTIKNEASVSSSWISKIWNFSFEIGKPNDSRVEFNPSGVRK